eukprot:CAMPEP_0116990458 /NCGR_PEP_ID=MMETSP0467-20121206/65497_1 /TAXON_ID=283647 /ORGANISM="Mesodinium pulex, Strain SPMC105" /LENGTH=84 /DNA_ID=CAMNT_0004687239 /DNA_START=688 /DNA_END=942 /DNA_ORIENTATION=-
MLNKKLQDDLMENSQETDENDEDGIINDIVKDEGYDDIHTEIKKNFELNQSIERLHAKGKEKERGINSNKKGNYGNGKATINME